MEQVKLYDTDRLIFEMKDLTVIAQMEEGEAQEMDINMGIRKIEVREEFAGEGDDQGQEQNETVEEMLKK